MFGLTLLSIILVKLYLSQAVSGLLVTSAQVSQVASTPFPTGNSPAQIGTNLSQVTYWRTARPFLDAFKLSRGWIPQCTRMDPGCRRTWTTGEENQLDLDPNGWVKSLPAPDAPAEYTRVVRRLFQSYPYPGGQYLVLYDGEGTIDYRFDARKDEAASTPGRDVLEVTPSDQGILLTITATDPNRTGNYIRNIRVIPAQYEQTYQTQHFNPAFLDRIRKFKVLRFMDWMETNDSRQGEWANRPLPDRASYVGEDGVPLEMMLALVNQLNVDPWFTMPHLATDDYMTKFAQMVKEQLRPAAKVYVEYSNEVWNPKFEQHHWATQQAVREWGQEEPHQWYGKRAAETCDLWKGVFAESQERVVCIMATQAQSSRVAQAALSCSLWSEAPCRDHGIDALAIAPYFGGYLGHPDAVEEIQTWLNDPDGGFGKLFTDLQTNSILQAGGLQRTLDSITTNFAIAQNYGLELVAYEGGQHLVGRQGVQDNEPITNFLIEANRRPEMYTIYTQLLQEWQTRGGELFMHYNDISQPTKWGSWGALEHVDQEHSPKYDALIDFIENHP